MLWHRLLWKQRQNNWSPLLMLNNRNYWRYAVSLNNDNRIEFVWRITHSCAEIWNLFIPDVHHCKTMLCGSLRRFMSFKSTKTTAFKRRLSRLHSNSEPMSHAPVSRNTMATTFPPPLHRQATGNFLEFVYHAFFISVSWIHWSTGPRNKRW